MTLRYFLIEDDPVVRKMLKKIIAENNLGEVVGQAEDGLEVSYSQLYDIDVVLIDLLMPGLDGIETIKKLRYEGFKGQFIMISQVENKEMIGQAYLHGIDTYIQKPINRYEVISVLKRVAKHISAVSSLHSIRNLLLDFDETEAQPIPESTQLSRTMTSRKKSTFEQKAHQLLLTLGIAGEAGTADLLNLLKWMEKREKQGKSVHNLPQLKKIFAQIVSETHGNLDKLTLQKESRAMEQRVRRLVLQVFNHLSSLGVNDYTNPIFEHFAPRLFDFEEIRRRMNELEANKKTTNCRINLKKFLVAFYMETN